ncbi:MAG: fibronectin type III domain-containing protein [Eubacterium sp.]|nr:fibronectin type III domain-containing protein [Eubacterium sp.]
MKEGTRSRPMTLLSTILMISLFLLMSVKVHASGGSSLSISGTIVNSQGVLTLVGQAAEGRTFKELYVDNKYEKALSGSSFTYKLDLKKLDPGMHTAYAELDDGSKVDLGRRFPVHIYDIPEIATTEFKTYGTYLLYTPNHTGLNGGLFCLSVKAKGASSWSSIPPKSGVSGYNTLKLTGLKPNTTYQVRAFYSKDLGEGWSYTGDATGSYSKIVTIKTGPKAKPPVKSIKISGAKVKKVKILGKWYKGKWYKSYYVYETTFKVTVTMKKKPGCAGIYIGKKLVKGNKKKYTAKFTESGKMKGKKVKVSVYTYGNKSYGACSPSVVKKVKVN